MAQRLKPLLRVCAVGSSLLLVAAWVAYRAGAWGSLRADSTAATPSPSPTTESAGESLPEEKPIFLGGSKSLPLEPLDEPSTPGEPRPRPRPRARPTPTATEPPESGAILGGSKSLVIVPSREPFPFGPVDTTPTPASGK